MAKKRPLTAVASTPPAKPSVDFIRRVPRPNLIYGASNQYSEITFGRLASILERSDRGDTVEWADLAERMITTDAHLASVYESRLAPIAGARWEVNPGIGGDPRLAQQAADDCRAILESLPRIEQFFYLTLHGIGVGYAVHEIVWTMRRGVVVPSDLTWLHPRRFRFSNTYELFLYDDGRAYGYADPSQRISNDGAQGMRLSADKYVIHQPQTVPTYAPSSGLLRTVARQWWVTQWLVKYWLGGAELAGNPRIIAKYPPNATAENKAQLLEALESLASDGIITMSGDIDIDIRAPLAQGSASVWSELLDRMDAAKSKAILGSTLNVEVGSTGGNRAAAESQFSSTIMPRAERDGRALWSTVERDLFKPFLKFNIDRYGGVMPPMPRGRFVLYEESADFDNLLVSSKALTVDELRSRYGLEPFGPARGGDRVIGDIATSSAAPAPEAPKVEAPDTNTADVAEAANVDKAADAALNGAQVASLMQIVQAVASGQIPRESGIAMITAAFPLSRDKAEEIMGPVGTPAFVPRPQA